MYLILMVYACLISCSLINKSKCHSLAYFNLRWTCVVILHKLIFDQSRGHENPGMRMNYFLVKIRGRFRRPHVLSVHLRSQNWMLINYK